MISKQVLILLLILLWIISEINWSLIHCYFCILRITVISYNQTEPRRSDIEFYSAFDRVKKVTVTLPDGYEFENVPKSKKFRTEDNALQYAYVVTQTSNKLTVETTVKIDDSIFPKEYYPAFKQIYDNVTKMEAQVVTAVKKK